MAVTLRATRRANGRTHSAASARKGTAMKGRRSSRSAAVVLAGCVGLAVMAPGLALAAPLDGLTETECTSAIGTWNPDTDTCEELTADTSGGTTGGGTTGGGTTAGTTGGSDRTAQAARWHDASRAIDGVRERFGAAAIGPASSVAVDAAGRRRVRVVRPGAQQWGPDHDGTGTDPSAR